MINDQHVPKLLRGVRIHNDKVRGQNVLLAPERAFTLDDVSFAILSEIDGIASFKTICERLAKQFNADIHVIKPDCAEYLKSLHTRILLEIK